MKTGSFTTQGGIQIQLFETPQNPDTALQSIYDQIDTHAGAVFSSGFDYPGRHSRWDIGFINPALEFITRGRQFTLKALNEQGASLLEVIQPRLESHPHLESVSHEASMLQGKIRTPEGFFTEEERSRQPSVFSVIRELSQLFKSESPFAQHFGFYGAFGYDLVLQFEDIKLRHERNPLTKDCHLFLPLEVITVDRKKEVAALSQFSISTPRGETNKLNGGGKKYSRPEGSGSAAVVADHEPGEFAQKVRKVLEGTACGDYFEVVLSQTFSTRFDESPTKLFQRIATINPSPYMFLLNMGDEQLVGASPELFVRVTGKRYETCPIAGTIPRGETALEDAARVAELMSSRKDESELTMCTDVDRNDMARVCIPGSVRVIGRRQLEFYSHLIHTVDHVEGYLRDEFDAIDAFQTHMWACTVTGAPKPAAIQEIENLEKSPRGWYSGAIGFLSFQGNFNTGITLRTANLKEGRATLRAGATLLYGSDPNAEEQETRTKAAAFLAALAGANESVKAPNVQPKQVIQLSHPRKVLLVDYKDSFVHNLAAYLRELGAEVITVRAGFPETLLDEIRPDLVLLSPGPGTPEEFGVPDFVGRLAARKMPTFGVCLGHQGIGQHFGATLSKLPVPEHGKTSLVNHNGSTLFQDVQPEFEAGRYHSLYLIERTIPDCLEMVASTLRIDASGSREVIPMSIRHKTLPIAGVQFHPESLMTLKQKTGHLILRNAIETLTK